MNIKTALQLDKSVTIAGEYNGERFSFTAMTNVITPRFLQRINDANERPIEFAAALAEIIPEWDLDMEGEPFPPTAENLAILPTDFLAHLFNLITGELKNQQQSTASAAVA